MPILPEIRASSLVGGDTDARIDTLIQQLNEWSRLISNEDRTRIIKSDSGIEAITIGQVPDIGNGIMIRDEDSTRRAHFGDFPDGTIALIITKPGNDVANVVN